MASRIFLAGTFAPGEVLRLPPPESRHLQVRRLQPGDAVLLFNGEDGLEWSSEIMRIGRAEVELRITGAVPVDRELPIAVTLALGVPANERMDAWVEKATELGVAAIQPLICERSVLRLAGDRAETRRRHWRAVAASASEQCGRVRVPRDRRADEARRVAAQPGGLARARPTHEPRRAQPRRSRRPGDHRLCSGRA